MIFTFAFSPYVLEAAPTICTLLDGWQAWEIFLIQRERTGACFTVQAMDPDNSRYHICYVENKNIDLYHKRLVAR